MKRLLDTLHWWIYEKWANAAYWWLKKRQAIKGTEKLLYEIAGDAIERAIEHDTPILAAAIEERRARGETVGPKEVAVMVKSMPNSLHDYLPSERQVEAYVLEKIRRGEV